jgi:hypothetical protein
MQQIDSKKRLYIIVLSLAFLFASCETGGGGGGTPGLVYPLKVSSNGRYLVDQQGDPFLMIGDAPQALIINASVDEAELLLANRAAHGFNTVWINLLTAEYGGGRADASTFDGLKPFTTTGDFSTPNEAYFARSDEIIRLAGNHGITVILDPAETGSMISVMRTNGVDKCKAYGRYLGNRYKSFDNIVWMSGSDFQSWRTESDNVVVKAVAEGIKETDSRHIHTLQLNYFVSSSLDNVLWTDLVTLNAAYTYYPPYAEVLKDYNRTPVVPVFLIESDYEFENGADSERLRRQEYWSLLSGACGYVFGNGYIWPITNGWKNNLDTIGVIEFGYCRALFESRPWHTLVPDQAHTLVTAGYGTYWPGGTPSSGISQNDYVTAASTPDGKLALVYIPTARTITVDLAGLSGAITARWYDPTTGTYQPIAGSPFPNTGSQAFTTPGVHADGAGDWVLVLEAQ